MVDNIVEVSGEINFNDILEVLDFIEEYTANANIRYLEKFKIKDYYYNLNFNFSFGQNEDHYSMIFDYDFDYREVHKGIVNCKMPNDDKIINNFLLYFYKKYDNKIAFKSGQYPDFESRYIDFNFYNYYYNDGIITKRRTVDILKETAKTSDDWYVIITSDEKEYKNVPKEINTDKFKFDLLWEFPHFIRNIENADRDFFIKFINYVEKTYPNALNYDKRTKNIDMKIIRWFCDDDDGREFLLNNEHFKEKTIKYLKSKGGFVYPQKCLVKKRLDIKPIIYKVINEYYDSDAYHDDFYHKYNMKLYHFALFIDSQHIIFNNRKVYLEELNIKNDYNTLEELLYKNGVDKSLIRYIYSKEKEKAIDLIETDFDCNYDLKMFSRELLNDKDVMLAAIKQDDSALSFASEKLQNDKSFLLKAVKISGLSLEFANPNACNDKQIVMEAVKQNGTALKFASEEGITTDELPF